MTGRVEPACPRCRAGLEEGSDERRCQGCGVRYRVVAGISDLRVFPDPFLPPEADHAKARRLAERAAQVGFHELLEHYWALTPEEPPDLVRRYLRHDLAGEARGEQYLRAIEATQSRVDPGTAVLELGCRTGGFLVAAAARGADVTGIDIALRWLVVARRRLEEHGLAARLTCACAQALPFPDRSFDLVVAGNVLEHAGDAQGLLREARRVLRPGGLLFAVTCNRFSLGPEPHVRVWGVGFLPRRLMSPYVRWARGHPYEHVRLVSACELRRLMRRARFERSRIEPGGLSPAELDGVPPLERRLAGWYALVRRWPLVSAGLRLFGPLLQVTAVKGAA